MEQVANIEKLVDSNLYDVNVTNIPSFLEPIFRRFKKVIFISKKANESSSDETYTQKINNTTTDLELTGSPLKYSFGFPDDDDLPTTYYFQEQINYIPVPLQSCRELLSQYNLSLKKSAEGLLPVWVFCDDNNSSKVLLQTAHREGYWHSSGQLIFRECWSRAQLTDHLDVLDKKHNQKNFKVKCEVIGTYSIYSEALQNGNNSSSNKITLEMVWSALRIDPPVDKKCTLVIQTVVGNLSSEVSYLWEQLLFLQDCVFKAYCVDDLSCPIVDVHHQPPTVSLSVKEKVSYLLEKNVMSKHPKFQSHLSTRGQHMSLSEAVKEIFDSKYSTDFTDNLWLLITQCKDKDEMVMVMNTVLEEIVRHRPTLYFRDDDDTCLREIIKGLLNNNNIGAPVLQSHRCFELVAEIGMRKLINDYLQIFVSTQFATMHQLKKHSSFEMRNILAETYNAKLSFLGHLHAVLEVLMFVNGKISHLQLLLQQVYSEMFRRSIIAITPETPLQAHTVSVNIPVSSQHFEDQVDRCFSSYHIAVSSSSGFREFETILYCNIYPLFAQKNINDTVSFITESPDLLQEEKFFSYELSTNKIRLG